MDLANVDLRLRHRVSALDDAHEHRNHRDDQQYVNKSAQGVGTDHSQEPKNQEHGTIVQSIGDHPFWQKQLRMESTF